MLKSMDHVARSCSLAFRSYLEEAYDTPQQVQAWTQSPQSA